MLTSWHDDRSGAERASHRRIVHLLPLLRRLLALAAAALALMSTPAAALPETAWTAASLHLPEKETPWRFAQRIDGSYVVLDVPTDLSHLAKLPSTLRTMVQDQIRLRNANLHLLTWLAESTEQLLRKERFHRVPQYDRSMGAVVISLDPAVVSDDDPLYFYAPILSVLPDYTRVHVFAPERIAHSVEERLQTLRGAGYVNVYAVPTWAATAMAPQPPSYPATWTQDIFRVSVNDAGHEFLFTPACYMESGNLCRWDADYLDNLAAAKENRQVVRLPIFYRAGNILMGETARPMLFIGQNILRFNSRNFLAAVQMQPPDEAVLSLLRETSGVAEVHVLPNSRYLFHLDMSLTFLGKGVAAVIDPLDKSNVPREDRTALQEIRKTLQSLGYRIVPIPTNARRIKSFESPVNVVTYVDRRDNRRSVIVPEYDDVAIYFKGKKLSLNQMVRDAYRNAGVRVIPVEDRFHTGHGNIHCALKVIN